jgi:hypothetical protein
MNSYIEDRAISGPVFSKVHTPALRVPLVLLENPYRIARLYPTPAYRYETDTSASPWP